jgi:hypothetical protein
MRAQDTPGSERPITYGYFLVGYIDLLAQQNELMKLVALPNTPEQQDAVLAILRNTAGKVKWIREALATYFATAAGVSSEVLESIPHARREEFIEFRSSDVRQVGFSDSFVISVPLADDRFGAAKNMSTVWSTLAGVASISLLALAAKIPLRGGIDVERGADVFPNEVYGPALVNAYQLESKVARYPRTVIGRGLLEYLASQRLRTVQSPWDQFTVTQAARCQQLICLAPDDQHPMLHMLAEQLRPVMATFPDGPSKAYSWVKGEAERFGSAGDNELADRYQMLARYFNAYGVT